MRYIRITKGLKDKGKLVPLDQLWDNIKDNTKDYYSSLYYYTEEHLKEFEITKSVKGIKDVLTDKLLFDFDSKSDPEKARLDSLEVIRRLNKYGIDNKNVEIYFSGNKGFNVVITLNKEINPETAYDLAVVKFGKDLETLDTSMYDANQIIRIPGTRHQESGLFKIPLSYEQLNNLSIPEIKELAVNLDNINDFEWDVCSPNDTFYTIPKDISVKKSEYKLNLSDKPSQWKNCKWSLLQGNFKEGERHQALLVLAASCRGLGYDKETTYYMCKSALKKQSHLTGQQEFPKEELWDNIIEQSVFTDNWEGGQYSCKKPGWLSTYCQSLGEHKCSDEEEEHPIVTATEMSTVFSDYATNFEKNLVKTGIKTIDDNVMFLASTHNGILGAPGSGKTSFALEYLHNTSMQGIHSTMLSLDMGIPIIFAKLVQKKIGCSFNEALNIFKNDPKRAARLTAEIQQEYKNVGFNFKSGLTVPDIKNIIKAQEEQTGEKVKLLITDYLECIAGPYSDSTANVGFISNQMKDLANDLGLCSVMLLQTQKHSTGDISDPLLSMRQIKGSSVIEQSSSVVLTLWREGYSPKTVNDDRYISFAAVKNRFGSLWMDDFRWDGVRGLVRELSEEERDELSEFRTRKKELREAEREKNGWQ